MIICSGCSQKGMGRQATTNRGRPVSISPSKQQRMEQPVGRRFHLTFGSLLLPAAQARDAWIKRRCRRSIPPKHELEAALQRVYDKYKDALHPQTGTLLFTEKTRKVHGCQLKLVREGRLSGVNLQPDCAKVKHAHVWLWRHLLCHSSVSLGLYGSVRSGRVEKWCCHLHVLATRANSISN